MPRFLVLILSALLLAVGAFSVCYFTAARARHAAAKSGDELTGCAASFI